MRVLVADVEAVLAADELHTHAGQVLLPRPMTRPVGGVAIKDAELLAWATAAVKAIFG